jgi:hypothetical protein
MPSAFHNLMRQFKHVEKDYQINLTSISLCTTIGQVIMRKMVQVRFKVTAVTHKSIYTPLNRGLVNN